jgi:hypothetical protein
VYLTTNRSLGTVALVYPRMLASGDPRRDRYEAQERISSVPRSRNARSMSDGPVQCLIFLGRFWRALVDLPLEKIIACPSSGASFSF